MKEKERPQITYEIILSNENSDYLLKLNSLSNDYRNINLDELVKRAKNQELKEIRCLRMNISNKDIKHLKNLGVYTDVESNHDLFYNLFFNKEDYDNNLKLKNEYPIEGGNRLVLVGVL